MAHVVEPLEWDSEFFGVSIGHVDLDGADEATLTEIDTHARDIGTACLFGTLDPGFDPQQSYRVEEAGHRLVEVSLLFDRPAGPFAPEPTSSSVRCGTEADIAALGDALDVIAAWSRFAVDPRFGPESARRMYDAWVLRALREPERLLSIAEDERGITGVAACGPDDAPRIDLIGVVEPGTGASAALMRHFLDWCGGGPSYAGPSAARNIAVLRFWERCGFRVKRTRYLYHRWLDDEVSTT